MTNDSNFLGCYAETLFSTECIKRGIIVSKPLLDSSPYDVIVDDNDSLFKVQIKYNSKKPTDRRNSVLTTFANQNNRYSLNKVDYFAIYVEHYQGFFIIRNEGNVQAVRLNLFGKYSQNFNKFVFK